MPTMMRQVHQHHAAEDVVGALRSPRLTGHSASVHEDAITFSNQ